MQHEKKVTYKLIYCIGRFQGKPVTRTVYTGKTWDEASEIMKVERHLTAVAEVVYP